MSTGCLAQGAYYITSNGEVAIIDPLRETEPIWCVWRKIRLPLNIYF